MKVCQEMVHDACILIEYSLLCSYILDNRPDEEKYLCDRVRNIERVRAFGLLLEIEPWKLDGFEKNSGNTAMQIVSEWFKTEMNISERRKELYRVLSALGERKLANELQPHFRHESSFDSAISGMSGTPRSSITSSTTEVPPRYQLSYIRKWQYPIIG